MTDIWLLIYWFIMIVGLGSAGWPILWALAKRLPDGGFGVSIPFSTVLVGWIVWVLSSLRLVPFSPASVGVAFLALLGVSAWVVIRRRDEFLRWMREHKHILLLETSLLLVAFLFWGIIRGYQPDIQGLEKFMDAGFVQSILKSRTMPPADPWLAGETINYYYFGHFLSAMLTLISGLELIVTYNLLLAGIFATSALGGFSVILSVVGPGRAGAISGILGAILLNLGGNLHPLWFRIFRPGASYWYPDATRFIPYTIHEFPAYSHVVADLHGHLINLSIVLLFLALLVAWMRDSTHRKHTLFPLVFGFLLGVFSMANTWDVPIYGLVFAMVTGVLSWVASKGHIKKAARTCLTAVVIATIAFVFSSILFHIRFHNIAQGVALVEERSPFWQLGVLWGGFLVICGVAVWHFGPRVMRMIAHPQKQASADDLVSSFPLIIIAISLLLLAIPEFVYVKDIYIKEYHRANTMFKLTYQSFVMFCLLFGITLGRLVQSTRAPRGVRALTNRLFTRSATGWSALIGIAILMGVFLIHMTYPLRAIKGYYGDFSQYRGLNGLGWFRTTYPDDYAALLWMRENIDEQPVILEAVGESYTDFARMSTFTGLPTVLGWRVHEWLWRGSFDEAGKRTGEVQTMYEKPTSAEAQTLFATYNVRYIVVGQLERQTYQIDESALTSLGRVIFRFGDTIIVERV